MRGRSVILKDYKMTFKVKNDVETEALGFRLAERLATLGIRRAVIAMRGEMGVGKTVFTRGFASYFGISGVKSPTYTVVNEYRGKSCSIFHFDLYRISDSDDLYSVGYDDYLARDGYSIIEWSERIPEEIPEDAIIVSISRTVECEDERIIEISSF